MNWTHSTGDFESRSILFDALPTEPSLDWIWRFSTSLSLFITLTTEIETWIYRNNGRNTQSAAIKKTTGKFGVIKWASGGRKERRTRISSKFTSLFNLISARFDRTWFSSLLLTMLFLIIFNYIHFGRINSCLIDKCPVVIFGNGAFRSIRMRSEIALKLLRCCLLTDQRNCSEIGVDSSRMALELLRNYSRIARDYTRILGNCFVMALKLD